MSKKKKGKKNKEEKQKKADGNRLSKLGKNASSLGTALVGAVAGEGTQATIAKVVERADGDRLDDARHTIKEAAGTVKNIAGAVQAALDHVDASAAWTQPHLCKTKPKTRKPQWEKWLEMLLMP